MIAALREPRAPHAALGCFTPIGNRAGVVPIGSHHRADVSQTTASNPRRP